MVERRGVQIQFHPRLLELSGHYHFAPQACRNRRAAEEEMTPAGDAAYVAAVLMLYTDLPDTPLRPSSQDQAMARRLHQQGVPLPLVESALLLASRRRLIRPGLPPLPRIRSLAYLQSVIAERQEHPLPEGYLDYLRLKFQQAANPCGPRLSWAQVRCLRAFDPPGRRWWHEIGNERRRLRRHLQ